MADYMNFYEGSKYGLDSDYGDTIGYPIPVGSIGLAVDPRTANQLRITSSQFNTGAKTVEVQGVSPEVFESIPNQHLEEINRLKKLVGGELTFHGPLVEPSGFGREGWDESRRVQAEKQIFSAVERSHKLDPQGNLVVTMHSSSGLPEGETTVIEKGERKITGMVIVAERTDERTGQMSNIIPKENFMLKQPADARRELDKLNKDNWFRNLSHTNFQAHQGESYIGNALKIIPTQDPNLKKLNEKDYISEFYKKFGTEEGEKELKKLGDYEGIVREKMQQISHGDIYLRDAYNELQNLFNQAYYAVKKSKRYEDLKKLNVFRDEISKKKDLIEDPTKIKEFSEAISQGVNVLRSIKPPEVFRPLNEFAIDKSSDTFANVALQSYKQFKGSAPIISIENPPAGGGLSRGEELKQLIEATRKKFVERAVEQGVLSESEAKRQAEKLIGATWDVGHINMLRKYGFEEKHLLEETKKIAPFVKHIHLSDNFGMEHTELPMGMGNVPIKKEMEILEAYNKKVKKIVEAGNWYQHFQTPPFMETIGAFSSPVYGMQAPYWNQISGITGDYFAGQGLNPEIHHSIYGAGFGNIPVELGGQMQGRARMGGAPIE